MRVFVTVVASAALAGACAGSANARPSFTYLGCGGRYEYSVTARPAECFLDWPDLSLAKAIDLRRIRWSRWGGPVATARAAFRTKTYDPYEAVGVRALRRRRCRDGILLYTRVRVSFRHRRARTWRTPTCSDVSVDD